MSRLLVAQRALTVPGWAKDALWRNARAVPSLDLRFADNKSLVDAVTGASLVTFTRASSGTFVDSAGVLQTAATDAPRFDHNPTTGESLGLLVEEQRTNSIRNNTGVGAIAGTPGTLPTNWFTYVSTGTGVSTSVISTGTDNGVNYVDIRFNGTPSASAVWSVIAEPAGIIPAATGQTWTYSAWVKIASGAASNVSNPVFFFDEAVGSTYVTGQSISTSFLTSALNRYPVTYTLTGGVTINRVNAGLRFSVTSGQAIDITLRIGLPQLEQGAFATSPILTSTAAATRSADVASITGSAFTGFYRQDEGTMFADFLRGYSGNFFNFPNLYQFNDGTDNNEITLFGVQNGQFVQPSIRVGAIAQLDFIGFTSTSPGPNKSAHGFGLNSSTLAANGVITTPDTSVNLPAVNQVNFGVRSGQQFTGHYRRICYWPQALPSRLQALTQ